MADLTQAFTALRAADAAGDTAGAQRLADFIRSQQQQPELQPVTPSVSRVSRPAASPTYADVLQSQSEGAIASDRAVAAGVPEAFRRTWGSIKQLGADASDAWNTYINPKVDATTGQGVMPTVGAQVTAAENQRRQQVLQGVSQQYGPDVAQGANDVANIGEAGLTAAPALATEGLVGPSDTFLGNALRQTLAGGSQGALLFSPDNSKGSQIAIGAGAGATIGLLNPVAAFNASLNAVSRAVRAGAARAEAAYQSAKGVMGWGTQASADAGTDPTLAMRTGLPFVRSAEARSFGAQLQARYAAVQDHFLSQFRSVFGLPAQSAEAPAMDDAFSAAQKSAQGSISGLASTASRAWEDGMDQVTRLSGYGGGGNPQLARIQPQAFRSLLNQKLTEEANPIAGRDIGSELSNSLNAVRAKLRQQGGSLSVQDTASLLKALTRAQNPENTNYAERAVAGKLRTALDEDLDAVQQAGANSNSPPLQALLATRAQYKAAQTQIRGLADTASYRFLGVDPHNTADINPATLVQRFEGLEPGKQREVAGFLRQNSPALLKVMRQRVLTDAANSSTVNAGAASNSELDPAAVIDKLFSNGELKTSGLWSPQEQRSLEQFRQASRVMANVSQKAAGGAGTIIGPEDIAPNIVSRNLIFIARQGSRALFPGIVRDIFSDPSALDYFTAKRATSGSGQAAMRAVFNEYYNRGGGGNGQGAASSGP